MHPLAIVGGIAILGRLLGKKKSQVGLDITGPSGYLQAQMNRGRGYGGSVGAITKADRLAFLDAHAEILTQGFPSQAVLTPKVRQAIVAAKTEFKTQLAQGRPSTSAAQLAMTKYKRDVKLTQKLLISVLNPLVLGVKIAIHKKVLNALKAMGNLDARITSSGFTAPKPIAAQPAPKKPEAKKEAAAEKEEEEESFSEDEEGEGDEEPTDDEIREALEHVQGLAARRKC